MKKQFFKFLPLITAAMLATACDKNDEPATVEPVSTPSIPQPNYTLTITATKGADNSLTKALNLNDKTLNATWKESEGVTVYQNGIDIGYLEAQSDGASTTLTGKLYNTPINGKATLKFNETNYIGQDGTLDHIASRYDYAEATITITGITGNDEIITAEKSVDFENQQAIVKFSLQCDGNPVNAEYIIVNGIKITPAQATNEIYAAIPGATDVHITAFDGTHYYKYSKSKADFENGNYYIVNVSNLKERTKNVNLSDNEVLASLTTSAGEIEIPDGSIVTGTLREKVKISIAPDATVTLKDVTIIGEDDENCKWAGITCIGNTTLILEGTNIVKGFDYRYPGIFIEKGSTLTLDGTGSLTASSNGSAAGIGSGDCMHCGNITINGGTINAEGGNMGGAGIGGGVGATNSCGNITINGGTINARGRTYGPGIGACGGNGQGYCGNITITGGTVNAQGGNDAPGIGGGCDGICGNITITGGNITAVGNETGAGIGSSTKEHNKSECGDITITSGVNYLSVTKGEDAPNSIGAGADGSCGTVIVFGEEGPITENPYTENSKM